MTSPADGVRTGGVGYGGQPVSYQSGDALSFATRAGIVSVEPRAIPPSRVPPLLHLERIVVDGHTQPRVLLPAGTRSLAGDAITFAEKGEVFVTMNLEPAIAA
jgi:hypothetical protein